MVVKRFGTVYGVLTALRYWPTGHNTVVGVHNDLKSAVIEVVQYEAPCGEGKLISIGLTLLVEQVIPVIHVI